VVTFITRRVIAAFFIVLGASFLVFILMANAGDPLAFLVTIQDPTQRENLRRSLSEELNLDVNPVVRYFMWLGGVFQGDFGISTQTQQPVLDDLANRVPLSLKLITASLLLAVLIGIVVGIVTAIKQYSGFDYTSTFFTFVFFALPVFWIAVILKGLGGINFNDWLRDGAHFAPWVIALFALAAAGIGYSVSGSPSSPEGSHSVS
jgi:peptide/nickel transport system permease protein